MKKPYQIKLNLYAELIRLDKPIGIYLLLWPTLWALFLAADGLPALDISLVFILGVILMRSAGCAVNDFADRNIDPHVARTAHRPIASGRISSREALLVFSALILLAFSIALLVLNPLSLQMACVALALAASYPFMKRYHFLPQVHLGLAFAWSIPMAVAAISNSFPSSWAWLLFLATVLWTTAYDSIYAIMDREDDIKLGVRSSAILFGSADRLIIALLQLLTLLSLFAVGIQLDLRYWYFISLTIVACLFFYQQFLIAEYDQEGLLRAFKNNHYVGLCVFLGILMSDYLPV
ncbi:MAG: 4-hydroxybenzoate octaprenyltransferase [Gammaproteobacteria bacterium]|nr:4-hydroxybenzoate octaprenyltransferase [Gammaproteobacteria bacterium]